jgi:hypothetical protein
MNFPKELGFKYYPIDDEYRKYYQKDEYILLYCSLNSSFTWILSRVDNEDNLYKLIESDKDNIIKYYNQEIIKLLRDEKLNKLLI